MSILVTGASGLVGSRFVELFPQKDNLLTPDEKEFNLLDTSTLEKYTEGKKIDTVVHFAAYTNVSEGEKEKDNKEGLCWKLNVEGTRNLLKLFKGKNVHFIYISTDNVFPGSKEFPGPYAEDVLPMTDVRRLTWYGYTKLAAEELVKKAFSKTFTILRLIYPVRVKYGLKSDYLRKPLKLFDEGKLYPMFADQALTISFIDEISMALNKIIESKAYGVFHASSVDTATPYEIVSYFLKKARGVKDVVKKSSLDEFLKTVDSPVRYPKFGGLKVEKTQKSLGIKFSTWKQICDKLVEQGMEV